MNNFITILESIFLPRVIIFPGNRNSQERLWSQFFNGKRKLQLSSKLSIDLIDYQNSFSWASPWVVTRWNNQIWGSIKNFKLY